MAKRRVVVTGLGAVTPLGPDVKSSWQAVLEGKSGVGYITQFDTSNYPVRIAAEVKDFDPTKYMESKEVKKMDRFIHFAVAATQMAIEDSELKITETNSERIGIVIGSGMGGLPAIEYYHKMLLEKAGKG